MKKITMLCLLICSHSVLADMSDFLIKFSFLRVDDMLKELNRPPSSFIAYCKMTEEFRELEKQFGIEQSETKMSEVECRQRVLANQEKCTAQLSSKKLVRSKKEIKALTEAYTDCVLDFIETDKKVLRNLR